MDVKYNKNHQLTNGNLIMTEGVSGTLWWTFAILRTFTFIILSEEDDNYDKMMFMDEMRKSMSLSLKMLLASTLLLPSNNVFPTKVARDINGGPDTTGLVLKMFAFVDIKRNKAIQLAAICKSLEELSQGQC